MKQILFVIRFNSILFTIQERYYETSNDRKLNKIIRRHVAWIFTVTKEKRRKEKSDENGCPSLMALSKERRILLPGEL